MQIGVGGAFRKWRENNILLKIQQKMTGEQRKNTLSVLDGLLSNSKTRRIREAIQKFSKNRKIIEIQRNFLKRLLMSKAGMAVIAFKKIIGLPERVNQA